MAVAKVIVEQRVWKVAVAPPNDAVQTVVVDRTPRVSVVFVGTQGPPGAPAESQGFLSLTKFAFDALSGHRAVAVNSSDQFVYPNIADLDSIRSIVGITAGAISQNNEGNVIAFGLLSEPSWTWIPGKPIFLGALGTLTQTAPSNGFQLELARALSATEIFVDIKNPIRLL